MTDSFPRQYARTQRFTLGRPRTITVSSDGRRVIFLRSAAGDDPVNALWVLDVETGHERCVADPRVLLSDPTDDALPAAERARRERTREGAGGITGYATDAVATVVAFALGGRLFERPPNSKKERMPSDLASASSRAFFCKHGLHPALHTCFTSTTLISDHTTCTYLHTYWQQL